MDGKNNSILIDSNIVIYSAEKEYQDLALWLRKKNILVSDITRLEVLGYWQLQWEDQDFFKKFFDRCTSLPINEKIVLKAIDLRQQMRMSLGDALIGATAIFHQLPLVTANTKDFKHIEELSLIDPSKIRN